MPLLTELIRTCNLLNKSTISELHHCSFIITCQSRYSGHPITSSQPYPHLLPIRIELDPAILSGVQE